MVAGELLTTKGLTIVVYRIIVGIGGGLEFDEGACFPANSVSSGLTRIVIAFEHINLHIAGDVPDLYPCTILRYHGYIVLAGVGERIPYQIAPQVP
jgi:hypothetical protein